MADILIYFGDDHLFSSRLRERNQSLHWILQVQQNRSEEDVIEPAQLGGTMINVPAIEPRFRLESPMRQPEAVLHPVQHVAALLRLLLRGHAESLIEVSIRNPLHDIATVLEEEIECSHLGAALLHLEAQKAGRGADI